MILGDFLDFMNCLLLIKVPEKIFLHGTVFTKWQNFFQFSGYFGRKDSKQSGNSATHRYGSARSNLIFCQDTYISYSQLCHVDL
jgi:hypothetical protein